MTDASRPLLVDLFCCGGGAAMGYHRAGFDVIGVDIVAQPHYPFPVIQADATDPPLDWSTVSAIHASPPCQAHSSLASMENVGDHEDLIPQTRELLESTGLPWIMENVPGAPIRPDIVLCGSMFGLDVRRHRWFEVGGWEPPLFQPQCAHWLQRGDKYLPKSKSGRGANPRRTGVLTVTGSTNTANELPLRQAAMGIDWLANDRLVQAIPPAYSEHIGSQLLAALRMQ